MHSELHRAKVLLGQPFPEPDRPADPLDEFPFYRTVRAETVCRGCRGPKALGCVVCWGCFKYRNNPFKYFRNDSPDAGNLRRWLEDIAREES